MKLKTWKTWKLTASTNDLEEISKTFYFNLNE